MESTQAPMLKRVKPINFLFFRTETTVEELKQFFEVAPELYKEAVTNNLTVTGPVHWHYIDFYGDIERPFTLEIALPVSEVMQDYDGKFHFKRTEDFSCVSLIHEGNWLEIPKSYQRIMEFANSKQLQLLGINREVYVNVDFVHTEANSTEIQMGVQ